MPPRSSTTFKILWCCNINLCPMCAFFYFMPIASNISACFFFASKSLLTSFSHSNHLFGIILVNFILSLESGYSNMKCKYFGHPKARHNKQMEELMSSEYKIGQSIQYWSYIFQFPNSWIWKKFQIFSLWKNKGFFF